MCHIVRASVRDTVRDTAGDQCERSEGCCSIRAVGMHLRGGCLHGRGMIGTPDDMKSIPPLPPKRPASRPSRHTPPPSRIHIAIFGLVPRRTVRRVRLSRGAALSQAHEAHACFVTASSSLALCHAPLPAPSATDGLPRSRTRAARQAAQRALRARVNNSRKREPVHDRVPAQARYPPSPPRGLADDGQGIPPLPPGRGGDQPHPPCERNPV